ncbi:MAG: type III polyketide synthase [Acidiphilium sp.]|nr:type III polyketide synthase [Acidiphilium sp.]MDD4936683.1 type III polyketide synthase [Acidiphilium sp.]
MTTAYINRIGTAVPENDIHQGFVDYARTMLGTRKAAVFSRMAERASIEHRYSHLAMGDLVDGEVDAQNFYRRGAFPDIGARMAQYERTAPELAERAVSALGLNGAAAGITHLVVASCTGFTAPGLDQHIAWRLGLRADVQRTLVGFMGCAAAVPALRIAQAAVLADPVARVLVINLELCTLHLQETDDLETALTFMLFGDGCAATLVTAAPQGLAMVDFRVATIPDTKDLITWRIGTQGFLMHLSGGVPGKIAQALREDLARSDDGGLLRGEGTQAVDLWAVHGGGRTVLDAVESGFALAPEALAPSRAVLAAHGNMSSATVMFVLKRMMDRAAAGARGMAFGPGMVAETFRFSVV